MSVPLEDAQASRSLQKHMFAFRQSDVDARSYLSKCALGGEPAARSRPGRQKLGAAQGGAQRQQGAQGAGNGTAHGRARRLAGAAAGGGGGGGVLGGRAWRPPEEQCRLGDAARLLPIPVFPVAMFPGTAPALQASYRAFDQVRRQLLDAGGAAGAAAPAASAAS
jgi:hypothetical protein